MTNRWHQHAKLALASLVGALAAVVCIVTYGILRSKVDSPANGPAAPRTEVENFRLLDHQGKSHELYYYLDARAIVLIAHGIGCPIVRQYSSHINDLRDKFGDRGAQFFWINANLQDKRGELKQDADEFGFKPPILKDKTQFIAKGLGITRTAEIRVIDPKTWTVVYAGAIDDRLDYGAQRDHAEHYYLVDALNSFLEGKPIENPITEARGCLIQFSSLVDASGRSISYVNDVAPILKEKCATCHRQDGVGPFAIEGYEDAYAWSSMIRETIRTKRMPPWFADPEISEFAGDFSLSADEERAILAWVMSGSPRGEGEDPLIEQPGQAVPKWRFGEPDMVISVPEQKIPATGVVPYRYAIVDPGVTEDIWVRATELRPGNQKVMHHALALVTKPGTDWKQLVRDSLRKCWDWYIPGSGKAPCPEGTGKLIPKNSIIVFQFHYVSTGKPEIDASELALYFSDKKPAREFENYSAADLKFAIPPGAREHKTAASLVVKRDLMIYGCAPHMHYRGKYMNYSVKYPDGRIRKILSVPSYRFDWQQEYRFQTPIRIPAGSELIVRGAFDNSKQNLSNPDPSKTVRFGFDTFDEMFTGYFSFAYLTDENGKSLE